MLFKDICTRLVLKYYRFTSFGYRINFFITYSSKMFYQSIPSYDISMKLTSDRSQGVGNKFRNIKDRY